MLAQRSLPSPRVLLIDDHTIVRTSLRFMLKGMMPHIQIIGEAGTGRLGVQLARELKPELVILDFKLPDISGLEVTQRLLKMDATLKILILTSETYALTPIWLLAAGAQAFLAKSASKEELKHTLEKLLNSKPTAKKETVRERNELFYEFSFKEIEVMRMMIRGDSVEKISQSLYLDAKTIYSYRSIIFKKLNVKNVVALTLLALRHGIVALEDL